MKRRFIAAVLFLGLVSSQVSSAGIPDAMLKKINAALPAKPDVKPAKPRKLLIFTLAKGFVHSSIPVGAEALKLMGEKTGAYSSVVSADINMFKPENLKQFDAVCLVSTTGELFQAGDWKKLQVGVKAKPGDPESILKKSLLDFVTGGKGLIGIHAATDCCYKWGEYGEMMGGYFDGHPWYGDGKIVLTLKLDDPDHPVNACFGRKSFKVSDEIYQFRAPYSRTRLHELLSIDTAKSDMKRPNIHRTDRDFAVSWVKEYGQGRVFYCSLGHREEIFWNPVILRHYLSGIQFAMGDLKADATPSDKAAAGKK